MSGLGVLSFARLFGESNLENGISEGDLTIPERNDKKGLIAVLRPREIEGECRPLGKDGECPK
jgi:hypothetical protein